MEKLIGRVLQVSRSAKAPGPWFSAKIDLGQGKTIRVKGNDETLAVGETIEFEGEHSNDPKWGPEFKASKLVRTDKPIPQEGPEPARPSSSEPLATEKSPAFLVLSQGVVRGIGPARAKKLVDLHGDRAALDVSLKTLKKSPPRGRAEELYRLGELMALGLTLRQATKAEAEFGADTLKVLSQNPYLLLRIDGLGFKFADALAMQMGVTPDDRGRCAAGLSYCMDRAVLEGSTGMEREALLEACMRLLGLTDQVILHDVLTGLESPGRAGSPVIGVTSQAGRRLTFSRSLYEREVEIAERLVEMTKHPKNGEPHLIRSQVRMIEQMLGFGLHIKQFEAVERAGLEAVFVLSGGPGTGKTTTVKAIYDLLRLQDRRVVLAAPTGKAAQRLGQACESQEAKTLHRLLEWHGHEFKQNKQNPLDLDAVIVDEASMIDVSLMHGLIQALPQRAKLILVGDKDQLPSVGAGQVLHDLLASEQIPTVFLEQTFRQGAGSPVTENAVRVNAGEVPQAQGSDFEIEWVGEGPGEEDRAAEALLGVYKRLLEEGVLPQDIQVLSPRREQGACSAHALSRRIQGLVNPKSEKSLEVGPWVFRLGDRVINTQNNYSKELMLANGDTGLVFDIDNADESLKIQVDGDRRVVLKEGPLQEIELAYALTVHKSQGSEFPVVIMPVISAHRAGLTRRLLYTGLTRAKNRVVLVAGKSALQGAVQADAERIRRTALADQLRG